MRAAFRRYGACAALVNIVLTLLLAVPPPARADAPRMVAFGDSLFAGYGLAEDEALPAKLEARLKADGFDVEVVNGGVSGDTTADGLSRLDWTLGDKPRYALVELGANDALRGLDPEAAFDNLDKILAQLKAADVMVLLIGMRAPANWGHEYQEKFDAIYPRLAKKWNVPLYPFLLDGVALDPKLNQADGLHPNAAGVAIIVNRLVPSVEQLLRGRRDAG